MKYRISILLLLSTFLLLPALAAVQTPPAETQKEDERPVAKNVLFVGDSMTGWLSERLNAYGKENGFDVSTIVWDGSTIKKWGESTKLPSLIKKQDPDVIFVSLGMNELFETNPSRFKKAIDSLKAAAGDVPIIWVGPPSWPGHNKGEVLNSWLEREMGEGYFFRSFDLKLPRQSKTNPHPTREGMIQWVDELVKWVESDGAVRLPGYERPQKEQMSRGKNFIYKRMKETL